MRDGWSKGYGGVIIIITCYVLAVIAAIPVSIIVLGLEVVVV